MRETNAKKRRVGFGRILTNDGGKEGKEWMHSGLKHSKVPSLNKVYHETVENCEG